MMKKLLSLVMALMLLAAVPAYAESFFPAIPTKAPAQTEYAPSYAACMGISPGQEYIFEGSLVRTYEHVTEEDFNRYGSYLQERGYHYTEDDCVFDYDISAMVISLTNDSISMTVTYGWDAEFLLEMYPEDVTPEQPSDNVPTAYFDEAGNLVARVQITPERNAVSQSYNHTVALKADGTVVAIGRNRNGQCNVSSWKDIVSVSISADHTVGLKADGTVVAVGDNSHGECDVSAWTDMVDVKAYENYTVGLKADGTVVATGGDVPFDEEMNNVNYWTDIIAVQLDYYAIVGLKADGTVVSTSDYYEVSDWRNIVDICLGKHFLVGLKSDGTVVSTYGGIDVGSWTDIVEISAGKGHIVGLKSDGTVVAAFNSVYSRDSKAACDVDSWTDIVSIGAGAFLTGGLKSDGTVVIAGEEYDVSGWTNIVKIYTDTYMDDVIGLSADGSMVHIPDSFDTSIFTDIRLPEN